VKSKYDSGYYLVAFLDVQGQRERFRGLRVPTTPEEAQILNKAVLETAGFVDRLRHELKAEFEENEERLRKSQTVTEFSQPKFVGFSDSLVMSVALWDTVEHLTMAIRVYSTLAAACNAMMSCFVQKHALRGGIDIALGVELESGEVYGTALENAYLLESRDAEYPRVRIGGGLWRFLLAALPDCEHPKSPAIEQICAVVRKTMALTCTDADGRRILDYLGEQAKALSHPSAGKDVKSSYDFVVAEHAHWTAAGNAKLSGRYALLRRYFESQLPLWGLSPYVTKRPD